MKTMYGLMCQKMVEIPPPVTWLLANLLSTVIFHNITDPYNMEPNPEPEFQNASNPVIMPRLEERPAESLFHIPYDDAPGLEALSAAATSNFEYIRPLSSAVQSPEEGPVSQHSSNNLQFILNPAGPEGAMSMCCTNLLFLD
jgi:hypothetical protein